MADTAPMLTQLLTKYGLSGMIKWAKNAIVQGWSEAEVMLHMKNHPLFHARFPAIKWREQDGRPPISVDQYLEFETLAQQLADTWGIKLDKKTTDSMVSNNVSPTELQERFNIVAQVSMATPEVTAELRRLYGLSQGEVMSYWMNPREELPKLQMKWRQAEVAGAALQSGYGRLTAEQAERLARTGMDHSNALTTFGQLDNMEQLFTPLDEMEGIIDQDMQVDMIAGNADIQQQVDKRAGRRVAEFAGSGGFAEGEEGFATGAAD